MKCPAEANVQRQKTDQGLPGAGGEGIGNCSWARFLWGDKNVLKLIVVMVAQPCECTERH